MEPVVVAMLLLILGAEGLTALIKLGVLVEGCSAAAAAAGGERGDGASSKSDSL
jgi:hypothetical protein